MRLDEFTTDDAVVQDVGRRIAQSRLERNWTQRALAEKASVGINTLRRLEQGEGRTTLVNLIRILRALELLGGLDVAIPSPGPRPLEELRRRGERRTRASGRPGRPHPDEPWTWGDET